MRRFSPCMKVGKYANTVTDRTKTSSACFRPFLCKTAGQVRVELIYNRNGAPKFAVKFARNGRFVVRLSQGIALQVRVEYKTGWIC